ncbi:MAG: aldo/keto reductase [Proteobacteria bacterium]|nr:MAG: aldo/keto reductase [Pseudomonadota bacterium]
MRYQVLGTSGLFVSEICLGTMTFGQSPGHYAAASGVMQSDADKIVGKALSSGINLIDTANVYANGQAEEIVGQAIKNLGVSRHSVHVATKAEHQTGKGPNDGGATRYHIMEQIKGSLKRLGTDYIDIYQMHGWDPATPVEETMSALNDLVRAGHIRYIGVSNWAAWQLSKALGVCKNRNFERIHSLQSYYSLAGRDVEREIVPMLANENVSMLVFSPLAGGYLTGKYETSNPVGRRTTVPFPPVSEVTGKQVLAAMRKIAEKHDITMQALAISWLLNQKVVASVVAGVKTVEQLESNLKACDVKLDSDDIELLDKASKLELEYPGWMFANADAARAEFLKTGKLQA